MRYGVPLSSPIVIEDGDYSDLAGASVVIVTAGINEPEIDGSHGQ